jgi:hypothetical protein
MQTRNFFTSSDFFFFLFNENHISSLLGKKKKLLKKKCDDDLYFKSSVEIFFCVMALKIEKKLLGSFLVCLLICHLKRDDNFLGLYSKASTQENVNRKVSWLSHLD